MKNLNKMIAFLSVFTFFLIPIHVRATTGTCITEPLGHGETSTNCSFSDQPSYCYYPSAGSCSTESDFNKLKQNISGLSSVQGMGSSVSDSDPSLMKCRADINTYQQQMSTYNQCMTDLKNGKFSSYSQPSTQTQVPSETDKYLQSQIDASQKFKEKIAQWTPANNQCRQKYGGMANANLSTFECECATGYEFFDFADPTTNLSEKTCLDSASVSQIKAAKIMSKYKNTQPSTKDKTGSFWDQPVPVTYTQKASTSIQTFVSTSTPTSAAISTSTSTITQVKVPFYKRWFSWLFGR